MQIYYMTCHAEDTAKEHFQKTWGVGYYMGWMYDLPISQFVDVALKPFYNPDHTALEIGCGGGFWTANYLTGHFRRLICIDVIKQPPGFNNLLDVEYIELPDRDFTCQGVEDNSIDFVWCYGCFCHLTMDAVHEYLHNIYQKVKAGSNLVIMFGNWPRHPQMHAVDPNDKWPPASCPWFYQDITLVKEAVQNAGFVDFIDLFPNFRDTIAHFKKP